MEEVRVRFAPSPTGALHIGGVRTALFNYLFAKKNKGKMILRIEDTDQARFVVGAESYIKESLAWIGIHFDEEPGTPNQYGPYKQSERKAIYLPFVNQLIDSGHAYYAFDTDEELQAMRAEQESAGVNPQYNSISRTKMKNSLTLSQEEVSKHMEQGDPYVIRIKVPLKEEIRFQDMIRGWINVHSSQMDDKVLLKSDGMPTYHLASVVDDHLMKISHVIRGEEWLPSAPLHILLYRYLGWESAIPQFAHLPLILKPDGHGKLSKRAAEKLGIPIYPINWTDPDTQELAQGFRESGYLPEALLNYLALLGWNPGTEKEIFTMQELCDSFSIDRIGKAGAKFDIQKAEWFNQQYLKNKSDQEVASYLLRSLEKESIPCSEEKAQKIAALMKERITFPSQVWEQGQYFFRPPDQFDEKVVSKKWNNEVVTILSEFKKMITSLAALDAPQAKAILEQTTHEQGIPMGKVMQGFRLALTGLGGGPDLMMIMEIIGKEEVTNRIDYAIKTLSMKIS